LPTAVDEHPDEMTYESDKNLDDPPADVDVATSAALGDNLSVAPTEMLAMEYKKLMDQYEVEMNQRKDLEDEIERIKGE
jgi:hypothetical protein